MFVPHMTTADSGDVERSHSESGYAGNRSRHRAFCVSQETAVRPAHRAIKNCPTQRLATSSETRPCPSAGPPGADIARTIWTPTATTATPGRRDEHPETAFLRRRETAEALTRQSANTASLSARIAELERSGMPLSTTTTSGGWRRTSRRAQVQARRRRSTGPLGVYAEEQTPRRCHHRGS